MKPINVALLLSIFISTNQVIAHPYSPLRPGDVTVVKYHFRVENPKGEMKADEVKGSMTMTKGAAEQKEGKQYFKTTTSYQNIPYIKDDQHLWRREEGGNLYVASMLNDKWNETLELPANVSVGQEWDYFDGVQSKRKVTSTLSVTMPDGKVLSDCIEVSRTVLSNESLKSVINSSIYCKDIGEVGSMFVQPSPLGDYTTETKIESFTKGAD